MHEEMIADANPSEWADGTGDRLCALLPSLFPGVVQFAFSIIRLEQSLTIDKIEEIYRDKVADGLQTNYYNQFDKRIGHYTAAERNVEFGVFAAILTLGGHYHLVVKRRYHSVIDEPVDPGPLGR